MELLNFMSADVFGCPTTGYAYLGRVNMRARHVETLEKALFSAYHNAPRRSPIYRIDGLTAVHIASVWRPYA
jgi:hypothetical protein